MINWLKTFGFALLSGGMLVAGSMSAVRAATSATLDILSNEPGAVDLSSLKPIQGSDPDAGKPIRSGNPLWAVPLSALTATRERPIFSATRRPPRPVVVEPHVDQVSVPAPQKAAGPEHPSLSLIGAVVGNGDAIAVFLDRTNQKIVRLRPGETHAGWELSAVLAREVTFKKADRTEVLALKPPDVPTSVPDTAAGPRMAVPAAGGATSFAPFVPRSTPRNGEPDGL
jgi:general secretion pathway protein N